MTGDREMFTASLQYAISQHARAARTLLATSGDTLALEHVRWTGADDTPAFEIDILGLTEVDADGRIVTRIFFDPDDRRAAAAEMFERWARSEAARGIPASLFEVLRAVNAHDLERIRATFGDDFALHDHRRTGLGRLEKEDYLLSLAALFEQAPDVSVETLYHVAVEKHGVLVVARNFGTLRDGGDFESVYVRIMLWRGDRVVRVEMFEPEDLDAARARFEELRG
jgi:ketosteroid isomerase-like protein